MQLYSWNVNGVRAVEKKGFVPWLLETGADILCLQETKAQEIDLPESVRSPDGYRTCGTSKRAATAGGDVFRNGLDPLRVEGLGCKFDEMRRAGARTFFAGHAYSNSHAGARLNSSLAMIAGQATAGS